MARRTHYRNGDEITLACGCNDCSPSCINGVLSHETGCPSAWKDEPKQCTECDQPIYSQFPRLCDFCQEELDEANRLHDLEELEGEPDEDDEDTVLEDTPSNRQRRGAA